MADMNDDEIEEKYDSETTEVDDIGAEDNTQLQQEPSAISPEPTQIDLTENDTPLTLTLTPTLTPRRSARSRTANEHYSESMFELSGRRQQVRESPPLVRQSRARTVSLSPPVLPSIPATHLPHTLLSTYSDEQLPILYNAPRVERRVPQSCIPLWVQATAMYLTDYQHARATDDEARATNALWQFMTLPARTMRLMRGGRRKRHRNIFRIRDRLLDIISGRNDHSAPGLRKAMRDRIISTAAPTEAAIDDAAMTRVARFVADGYLRKAKQALKSTQPLAPTADVEILKQLKTLHPQRTQAPPPLPLAATDYILTKSEMRLFVRDVIAMDNGTSGGPSQWTGHMLRVLTDNSECMRGLMCIINDIINGKVPTAARDLVTSSHLVAARKGDGRNGIRPIAIGEVLYRLASRCVNSAVLPHVGANLLNQYGVGDRNGTAQLAHQLQVRTSDETSPKAAITLDLRNAFNECDRRKVVEAAYDEPEMSRAWKLIDYGYASPTRLWMHNASGRVHSIDSLKSSQGVRQGDPMSPLLFALAWDKYVMRKVAEEFSDEGVSVVSYLDDTTIVAPVDIIFDVYRSVVAHAKEVSLHIQQAKCAFMYLHDAVHRPSQEAQAIIDRNVIPRVESLTVVGVPIGKRNDSFNAILQKRLDGLRPIFSRLKHGRLSRQAAFLLLRSCAQRQLDYLLRAVRPQAIDKFAAEFDAIVLDSAVDLLELHDSRSSTLPHDKLAMEQFYHALSSGGFGLRRATDTSPFAFLSAHVAAVREQPAIWQDISTDCPSSYRRLLDAVAECMDVVRERATTTGYDDANGRAFILQQRALLDKLLPTQPHSLSQPLQLPTLAAFYKKTGRDTTMDHLQTSLTRLGNNARFYAFRHPQSTSIRALSQPIREGYCTHMVHLTRPYAGRWLCVIPRDETTFMRDQQFIAAARIRLYLPARATMAEHCGCDRFTNEPGAYAIDPIHALSCQRTRGRELTERHDSVVDSTAAAFRACGVQVHVEARGHDHETDKRPDIFGVINGVPTYIDVGIVHPSAKSYRKEPIGAVADKYAAMKIVKYRPLAMRRNGVVLPMIAESSGGFGQHALNLLADLRRCASENAAIASPQVIVNNFLDAVAIGIQRGNALAVRRSVEMTQRDEYRRRVVSRNHRTAVTTVTRSTSLGIPNYLRSGIATVRRSLSLQ
jgi:hypothetical protein